ncbi:hypothetical protein A3SI_06259 [Nitritalea halalkaliphila LW7]|uniref:Uncharacterized protein n=1 Tax=Nitritalea halalkaliphila LW7 TaxID=1189621 RepID=I5C7E4_9BACT|nr:hypothetical protein A3SI_06259 [Nitritalea halalkaliphila LW7]
MKHKTQLACKLTPHVRSLFADLSGPPQEIFTSAKLPFRALQKDTAFNSTKNVTICAAFLQTCNTALERLKSFKIDGQGSP